MALTAQEIHAKEFTTRSNKWYDRAEVNEFLNQVVRDYDALTQENMTLTTKLAEADANASQLEEMKQSVNSSILVAQDAADRLKKQSESEAESTMQQAQAEAQKIVMEANAKANALITESQTKNQALVAEREALEKEMSTFKAKLEGMLGAQLDLVKSADWQALNASAGPVEASVPPVSETPQSLPTSESGANADFPTSSEVSSVASSDAPEAKAAPQTVVIFPEEV
jgi:cell division initiation protein